MGIRKMIFFAFLAIDNSLIDDGVAKELFEKLEVKDGKRKEDFLFDFSSDFPPDVAEQLEDPLVVDGASSDDWMKGVTLFLFLSRLMIG